MRHANHLPLSGPAPCARVRQLAFCCGAIQVDILNPLLNGASWFDAAITIAVLGLAWPLFARGGKPIPPAVRITHGVILLFGLYIGIMALGHLAAVTIKAVLGTLPSGSHLGRLFRIGFMFAIPAWVVVAMTVRSVRRPLRTFD